VDRASSGASLRALLKRETAGSHDRLDRTIASLELGDPGNYALFLRLQLAARAPIERWAADHCDDALRPPTSVPLLHADLARLGVRSALPESEFLPPEGAHPLGLAWAIAGSHLGNRALLTRLPGRGAHQPTTFLADPRLPVFWKHLRPQLEIPADEAPAAGALAAAEAVFACFTRALGNGAGRLAA
jgi:heme oxygenase